MEITLEQVRARREALELDKAKTLATLNAIIGAIQDCDYWQSVLEKQDQDKEKPT